MILNYNSQIPYNTLLKEKSIDDNFEFTLISQRGDPYSLGDFANYNKVYFVALSNACTPDLVIQRSKKIAQKAKLVFIDPVYQDKRELFLKFNHIVLMDYKQQLASSLGLTQIGEMVEFSNNKLKKHSFIQELKNDPTCKINYSPLPLTNFEKDIYPSFKKACLNCHAPLDSLKMFENHQAIAQWKTMMLKTMRLNRMPPYADSYYGELTEHVGSGDELKIVKWLESNKELTKEEADFLDKQIEEIKNKIKNNLDFSNLEQTKFEVNETVKIPATGGSLYRYFQLGSKTEKDIYFTKAHIKTNLNSAHHIILYISKNPREKKIAPSAAMASSFKNWDDHPEKIYGEINGSKIEGVKIDEGELLKFIRQKGVQHTSPGTTWHIPKDSYLTLEIHYNPSGKEETDRPVLTIFPDEKAASLPEMKRMTFSPLQGTKIIKANASRSIVHMEYTIKKAINLMGYGLHMHYRGVGGKLLAKRPGETEFTTVFSLPTYQFKIQTTANLDRPYPLPIGSILKTEMIYNNSRFNFSNPNPSTNVLIGSESVSNENHLPRILYTDQ